jgi:uncharacterized membrane protein
VKLFGRGTCDGTFAIQAIDGRSYDAMVLLLTFLIGFFTGLRSLTAPAATAWSVYLGWLKIDRPLALIGSRSAVVIFTLLAIVELVADKLPQTPNRTSPPGLLARILMGGLSGACVSAGGGQSALLGAMLGAAGSIVGCFLGYKARTGLVRALGTRDIYIASIEDLVAIAASVWVVAQSKFDGN